MVPSLCSTLFLVFWAGNCLEFGFNPNHITLLIFREFSNERTRVERRETFRKLRMRENFCKAFEGYFQWISKAGINKFLLLDCFWKKLHPFKHTHFLFHLKDHCCELEPCKSFQKSFKLSKLWHSTGFKYLEYFGLPV